MKNISWTCDNYCGQKAMSSRGCPYDWLVVADGASEWCFCSWQCAKEFAIKNERGLPMGFNLRSLGTAITVPVGVAQTPSAGQTKEGDGG